MSKWNPLNWVFAKSVELEHAIQATGELIDFVVEAADSEGKSEGPKAFKMVAYTGEPVRQWWLDEPVVVDLQGMQIDKKSRPMLRDHRTDQIVGHSTKIENTGKELLIEGIVSSATEHGREVRDLAKDKFPWQASIGAPIRKLEFIGEGTTVVVNGREFTGPIYVARQTILKETSFVALGADDNTSAKVAAQQLLEGSDPMFEAWLKANGFDEKTLTDAGRKVLKAQFDAEFAGKGGDNSNGNVAVPPAVKAAGTDGASLGIDDEIKAGRQRRAAEARRVGAIQALAEKYPRAGAEIFAKAIEEDWTAEKCELEAMRADRPHAPAVHTGGLNAKITAGSVEFALAMSYGMDEKVAAKSLSKEDCDKGSDKAVRGMSLHALMDCVIAASGGHFVGNRKSKDFIEAAFTAENRIQAASGYSTMSMAGVLGNLANKSLLAAYESQEIVHPEIVKFYSHNDFKPQTRYRVTTMGGLKKLGPGGEPASIGLKEASYSSKLETEAAYIALTRQMMIDDDLGVFLDLAARLGILSAIKVEETVFITFLANLATFFTSGNKNYISGASTVLDMVGLAKGVETFANQVDENNKPILVSPKILLCGTNNKVAADDLYKGDKVDATTTADHGKIVRNPHVGLYKPVATPYLNNTALLTDNGDAITGQTQTGWGLFASPQTMPVIGVATLNGKRTPTIESAQMEFQSLGMKWAAFLDFGVGMEDKRGAVWSKGAA